MLKPECIQPGYVLAHGVVIDLIYDDYCPHSQSTHAFSDTAYFASEEEAGKAVAQLNEHGTPENVDCYKLRARSEVRPEDIIPASGVIDFLSGMIQECHEDEEKQTGDTPDDQTDE